MAGRKRVTVDPEIESLFRTPAIRLQRLINEASELREQMEEKDSRIQQLTTEREDLVRNVTRLVTDNQGLQDYINTTRGAYEHAMTQNVQLTAELDESREEALDAAEERDDALGQLRLYKATSDTIQTFTADEFTAMQNYGVALVGMLAQESQRRATVAAAAAAANGAPAQPRCVITHDCPVCFGENGMPDTCGPCGHLLCATCAHRFKTGNLLCHICRGDMSTTFKIHGLAFE